MKAKFFYSNFKRTQFTQEILDDIRNIPGYFSFYSYVFNKMAVLGLQGKAIRTNWIRNHPKSWVDLREDENKISTYLIDDAEQEPFYINYFDKTTGSIYWQMKDGNYVKLGINVLTHEIKQYQNQWEKIMEESKVKYLFFLN